MNKARRAELNRIINTIYELQSDIDAIKADEEDARDNMPESLQGTERYEAMDAAVDELDDALSSIDDVIEHLEGAME